MREINEKGVLLKFFHLNSLFSVYSLSSLIFRRFNLISISRNQIQSISINFKYLRSIFLAVAHPHYESNILFLRLQEVLELSLDTLNLLLNC